MTDLTTFFERDPLGLEDKDFDEVIKVYREKRHLFNLGDLRAGSVKPAKTSKALAGVDAGSLKDLLNESLKI